MTQSSTYSADFELFQTYFRTNRNGQNIATEYDIDGTEKIFDDLKPDDAYSFIKSKFVQVTGFTPEQNRYLNRHKDKLYFDRYGHIYIHDSRTTEYFKNTFDFNKTTESPKAQDKLKFDDKKQTQVFLSPLQNKYFLLYTDEDDGEYSFEIYLNPLTENLPKYLKHTNNTKLLRDYCYMFPSSNICSCLYAKGDQLKIPSEQEDIGYCHTMAKSIADGSIKTDTYGIYNKVNDEKKGEKEGEKKDEKEGEKKDEKKGEKPGKKKGEKELEIEEVQGLDWYWLILIEIVIILLIGGGSYLYFSKT